MACLKCGHINRRMEASTARRLYARLKDHLRVVPPFGCYTPRRPGTTARPGDHSIWPLHHCEGVAQPPLVVEFTGLVEARRPTFEEFCKVYNLSVVVDAIEFDIAHLERAETC